MLTQGKIGVQDRPEYAPLLDNVGQLQAMLVGQCVLRVRKEAQVEYLLEQLLLLQLRQFGQNSESADRLGLFNEVEAMAEESAP